MLGSCLSRGFELTTSGYGVRRSDQTASQPDASLSLGRLLYVAPPGTALVLHFRSLWASPKESVGAPDQMTVSQHSKSNGWHPSPLSPIPSSVFCNFCIKDGKELYLRPKYNNALLQNAAKQTVCYMSEFNNTEFNQSEEVVMTKLQKRVLIHQLGLKRNITQ